MFLQNYQVSQLVIMMKTKLATSFQKMTYDIDTINTSLATDVMSIFTSIITVVISFVMMVIMSPT